MLGRDSLLVEGVDAIKFVILVADFEGGACSEAVCGHECLPDESMMLPVNRFLIGDADAAAMAAPQVSSLLLWRGIL
jgi:hypothetical protein